MSTLTDQIKNAVQARKDSLKELRGRLNEVTAPIPVGVKLSDDQGVVCRVVRVCTGASQWSNRTWEVTIKGRAL
jgi:hypothetical protein